MIEWHDAHCRNIERMHALIHGLGPEEHEERERLLWLLCGIHAGALTPISENEKRGMQRVLAILERKLGEGGGVGGNPERQRRHNEFYRARWSAFCECAIMLRSALAAAEKEPRE